jgi:hypothetical protein
VRLRIHRDASFAMLPLFAAEAAGNTSGAVTHRDVAITSISVASLGYAIMIFR